jgi:hypothetical protein
MAASLKKKTKRKKGGIRKYKFAMCARKCRGNRNYRNCMSACLRG